MVKFVASFLASLGCVLAGDGCSASSSCVCYDDAAYYSSKECYSQNSPWGSSSGRPLKALPDSPTKQKIRFELFSKEGKSSYQEINYSSDLIFVPKN